MDPAEDFSDPARDRALAARVRHGYRRPQAAGDALSWWLGGPDGKRLRRNAKVTRALREVLSEAELGKVEPVSIKQQVLTLAVRDNVLLSELRNHRHGALVHALVATGSGIGRVVYRLQRSAPGRR